MVFPCREPALRASLTLLALYGFTVARQASENIAEVGHEAAAGDQDAKKHFTQTRYAHVFGPKNSDIGMLYYAAVALAATTGLIRLPLVLKLLRLASVTTVALSLYLLWALLFRLRARCPICLRGHAVNGTLLALLLQEHDR